MKKTLSVILAAVMLILCASAAFAIPLEKGTSKLNGQFINGELSGKLDYVYFSPVKSEEDETKYPILVWLHGKNSGLYKRSQLNNYEFSNWSSDEYQARFASTGGCYLLAVRASTAKDNSWTTDMCSDLYATIEYFISLNDKNIDKNRIYVAGYSTGGTMVWDMLNAYPDYFAAAMPLASIFQPSNKTLDKLADVSIWMFCSDIDYYPLSETQDVMPNYDYLSQIKNDLNTLRLTSFSEAVYADGTKKTDGKKVADEAEHYIWECFTYDMHMKDGTTVYLYSKTVDGYGNNVDLSDGSGIISWLDGQSRENSAGGTSGKTSFVTRIVLWFNSIVRFFRSLFRL